jgi:hypothetical protein
MGPNTTNYVDSGLLAGTNYYYVMSAVLDGDESSDTAEVSAVPSDPIEYGDVVIGYIEINTADSGESSFSLSIEDSGLGHNYQVYTTESLSDPDWEASSEVWSGTGGDLEIELSMDASMTNCFYKLEAWQQ